MQKHYCYRTKETNLINSMQESLKSVDAFSDNSSNDSQPSTQAYSGAMDPNYMKMLMFNKMPINYMNPYSMLPVNPMA